MSYALLQKTLGEKISRQTLEMASVHVPSVAKADCARIERELFGIIVRGIPHDDAVAFQIALEHFQIQTEVVPNADLPALSPPGHRRGIRLSGTGFAAVDGLGREENHPWDEVQFVAGGFLEVPSSKTRNVMEWDYHFGGQGRSSKSVRVVTERDSGSEKEFRLELFLSCEPYRLRFRATAESVFRLDDSMLRLRDENAFGDLLRRIGAMFPENCLSLGVRAALRHDAFLYPSSAAVDEEIIWHLYRRLRS